MHTKILVRTINFNARYQQWIEKDRSLHLEMLRGSYANEAFGNGSADLELEYSGAYSRITWSPAELRIEDLGCMMDYFQSLMLKNSYYLNLSDERREVFDTGLKLTTQRHYLKPAADNRDVSDRQFGNVFIEHSFNSRFNSLSISANYHGQNQYHSFEKLMEILLG